MQLVKRQYNISKDNRPRKGKGVCVFSCQGRRNQAKTDGCIQRRQKGGCSFEPRIQTKVWIDSVLGSFSFNRRLLAWDSFECHIEDSITHALQSKKIDRVIVPGGCTGPVCPGTGRLLEQAVQGHLH